MSMQGLAWLRVLQRSRTTSLPTVDSRHHGLAHAVSSALAARRADVLRHLADRHPTPLMAGAMARLSPRQRADVLSLLTREQRSRICGKTLHGDRVQSLSHRDNGFHLDHHGR
jgi:hypothetical protein